MTAPDPDYHYHLRWYGHLRCPRRNCPEPTDDPSLDLACTHPGDCDGTCEAVEFNTARRAHLPVPPGYEGLGAHRRGTRHG